MSSVVLAAGLVGPFGATGLIENTTVAGEVAALAFEEATATAPASLRSAATALSSAGSEAAGEEGTPRDSGIVSIGAR